jgi:hypothetical protein
MHQFRYVPSETGVQLGIAIENLVNMEFFYEI